MKKFFSILAAFVCAMSLQAESTRIYCKMSYDWWKADGAAVGAHVWGTGGDMTSWPGQRMAAVFGEADMWYIDIDMTQYQNVIFTRINGSGTLEYWGAKTGDKVIPTDGKNLFEISTQSACWEGETCTCDGTWSSYEPSTEDPDYYLAGEGFPGASWSEGSHLLMPDGTISFLGLEAGTYRFKITNGTWSYSLGIGGVNAACSTQGAYSGDSDNNVVIRLAGEGDITITMVDGAICLTVVGETQGPGGNGVPSACGDVSMQGFYWNSYMKNDSATCTNLYGDNRWKTMLEQAGEIGAYFDMIWLPPSAAAGGTGYYPRQYSNQNSDWGSRADLEKLIASFHNSGMKVVADVVLDHMIAQSSWCDFATMDFGKYGKFTPDMSWICRGDEVNDPANKGDSLAGPCWGLATGPDDEGDNNVGARDLAHAKPEVQEFSKAYLQWLRDEMKYDGFRWDEAKGFDPAHIGEYNAVAEPYISFVERWSGNSDITYTIDRSGYRTMALDFMTKYKVFDGIANHYYGGCRVNGVDHPWDNSGLLGCGWSKYAVTFIDSHDWFLRNDQEFGGRKGQSMTEEMKPRLLQANAYMLAMPGVPSVFYPHWAKYKEDIKPMINARHLAGVHSESEVREEEVEDGGYKATIVGKNGLLILMLGNKTVHSATGEYQWLADNGYRLVAYGAGYAMWVLATGDVAPGIIVTPGNTSFEDSIAGIDVSIKAVGGSSDPIIYYTTDGSTPTTESAVYSAPLNFTKTTTLKVMAVCGTAQSRVQEYTYTYREPLQHGIRVRFDKPEQWNKAYIFAWQPYVDEKGEAASVNLMGAYPGQRMYQDVDGWFTYEFDHDLGIDTIHFCINSGNDCGDINVRSNDLETDYDICIEWLEGKETEGEMEQIIEGCEKELEPKFDLAIVPESGFFRDQNVGQEVIIRPIGDPDATIYYTTDGTEPGPGNNMGQGEKKFTVNKTTTVKAYAESNGQRSETYTAIYTYKAPQQGVITVKFVKPADWEDLYLYAFTRVMKTSSQYVDTPYSLDGGSAKWPGMKWTTTDGKWYTYTMREVIPEGTDFYIIFNAGMNKSQSQDIFIAENTCYLWSDVCYRAVVDADCDGEPDEPWTEGIEVIENQVKNNHEAYKLIINGQLVIFHNGAMYDVLGRKL